VSVLGISPLGTGLGPFGGPGLITVLGVLPVSNNRYSVVFDREPATIDQQAIDSGTNEENYVLEAIDPAIIASDGTISVPAGEVRPSRFPYSAIAEQDDDDPTQIIVSSEVALEPRVRYRVTISSNIVAVDGQTFAGPNEFIFRAPGLPAVDPRPVIVSEERYRDLDYVINANEQRGERNQIYRIESNNDIGIQDADTSLKKRVFRRIFTDPGGFAWAPGYGVGVKVKRLAKVGAVQELANTITDQILQEPDVINAGAEVRVERTGTGTFVFIDARIQRRDSRSVRLSFREPI